MEGRVGSWYAAVMNRFDQPVRGRQWPWYLMQVAILIAVSVLIGGTINPYVETVIALAAALLATAAVSGTLGLFSRFVPYEDKATSGNQSLIAPHRPRGNSLEGRSRARIGQDSR